MNDTPGPTPQDTPPASPQAAPAAPQQGKSAAVSPPPALRKLSNRLRAKPPLVRKIAMLDLLKQHEALQTHDVPNIFAAHLERETHPPLQLWLITFLTRNHHVASLPAMEKLAMSENITPSVKAALEDAIATLRQ